jgi:hypothetical protein
MSYKGDVVNTASNRLAVDENAISGSLETMNKPERTGSIIPPIAVASLRFLLFAFHQPSIFLSQVVWMICIPSAACNDTQVMSPA